MLDSWRLVYHICVCLKHVVLLARLNELVKEVFLGHALVFAEVLLCLSALFVRIVGCCFENFNHVRSCVDCLTRLNLFYKLSCLCFLLLKVRVHSLLVYLEITLKLFGCLDVVSR